MGWDAHVGRGRGCGQVLIHHQATSAAPSSGTLLWAWPSLVACAAMLPLPAHPRSLWGPALLQGSLAMPDVHSGYGFAIGNVAAFDMSNPEAVVSPGGVGFDINCGVRLIRTNLTEKDVADVKEQLAQVGGCVGCGWRGSSWGGRGRSGRGMARSSRLAEGGERAGGWLG